MDFIEYNNVKKRRSTFMRACDRFTACPQCGKPVTLQYFDENKRCLMIKHRRVVNRVFETTYCEISQKKEA